MKLAICSVGELFGGVERHILGMCTWLQREGHEFVLILFHDRELARQAREIGVEPVVLEARGRFDLGVPGRLAGILANHGVDVVHAHGYKAVVNCALARRKYKFPMVRTVHGLVESSGWWTPSGFKGNFYFWLERFYGRRAGSAVAYVTEDLRLRHARNDRGLATRTIYNGIDPLSRRDFTRPADLDPGVFQVAAMGRVTRVKGLENAIRAAAGLEPGLKVVLNIIGTGPLAGELKALATELGVGDRVRFLGFKKNVYDYLAHIDVLIMPSVHEGLPYTILEAMSLGIPIIGTRVGGLAEVIDDRENGMLIPLGDVEGLIQGIRALKSEPGLGEAMGRAARRIQADSFTLDTMGNSYQGLYNEAISHF